MVVQRRSWTVTVEELGAGDFTGISRDLVVAVHNVLTAGPDIGPARWHFEDVFMRGTIVGGGYPLAPRATGEAVGG